MASLAWQLAKRYRSTRHTSGFIRFISASSTSGIALGVAILILALSVMNGFEQALKQRLLAVIPHIELEAVDYSLPDWQRKLQTLASVDGVRAGAPFIKANGMLRHSGAVKAAQVRGINLQFEQQLSAVAEFVTRGSMASLDAGQIVLGQGIADALAIEVGQNLQLMLPRFAADGSLASHRTVNLTVSAVVSLGGQLDYSQVWVDINALSQWLGVPEGEVHGLAFQIDDVFAAPQMARVLGRLLEHHVYLQDWYGSQGHVYNDIQMVRAILYLVLTLVIMVACFNIVATLVMAVREKEADIAILLTMGMAPGQLIKTFVLLGWLNGLIGSVLGVGFGILLASTIEQLFASLTRFLGSSLLDPSIYFIDFVPSVLRWQDVTLTFTIALLLSLLATLYPAWRASKVEPAAVLGQH
ncbi:lipoprotein-releasing ABC transporter permease subunit [Arsukibacterium indicum]|uniref:Lipoprotein-releasing ABC transporter permease subunit n=1 Tax=Arsukibacterium indicum TaxID=2848612 RepID=A0ABS6MI22_9GAMM|nr:lipoprotein-releasing ABC transporter permease subunit [Arsukibacterium indicum]MBV2128429.1 lipoprotein-releasing ABC transporter permease subunit [Arsukibacterium indicum]